MANKIDFYGTGYQSAVSAKIRRKRILLWGLLVFLFMSMFILLFIQKADAAPLTDQETIQVAQYVKQLELENESLKRQNELYSSALSSSKEISIQISTQTQALMALYDHKAGLMDGIITRYESALLRMDTLTNRMERRIHNLETQNNIWQLVGIASVVYGSSH